MSVKTIDSLIDLVGSISCLCCFIIAIILIICLIECIIENIKENKCKLTGKQKFYLSIICRIILIILGAIFVILFNWKFGLSCLFFALFFVLNEKWKNYGK